VLTAAKEAGAMRADYVLLRLPQTVVNVFQEWLQRSQPSHAERIESRIRQTRGGSLYQSEFGKRMQGDGPLAQQIYQTFDVFRRQLGLDQELPELDVRRFRPPVDATGQGWLF
jgi:DNA repair photolyase